MVIAVPVLLLIVVVTLLLEKGWLARATAVLALLVGVYLGDTGFGHGVVTVVGRFLHLL